MSKKYFYLLAVAVGLLAAVSANVVYDSYFKVQASEIYFFYSDYCPHCREVKPYVDEFAKFHSLIYCNVDNLSAECLEIAEKVGVRFVPTIVVFNEEFRVFVGSTEVMKFLRGLEG